MRNILTSLILGLVMGLNLSGCVKKKEPVGGQGAVNVKREATSTPETPSESSPVLRTNTVPTGFDIDKVPVVNPQLGKFPYFGLIDGYSQMTRGSKDVDFDRYEFFDGTKIVSVEGRLATLVAEGYRASAFQVLKTYESLVVGLGGGNALAGESPEAVAELKQAFVRSGIQGYWRKSLELEKQKAKHRYVSAYDIAILYARLGEKEQAFNWLNKAYEERSSSLVYLKVEPSFDNLRQDPRLVDLLRRINLA